MQSLGDSIDFQPFASEQFEARQFLHHPCKMFSRDKFGMVSKLVSLGEMRIVRYLCYMGHMFLSFFFK